jgi:hypothetical protein
VPASLHRLQQRLTSAILEQQGLPEEICAGEFSAAERVQIYRRNTVATLTEALIACYPVVHSLVGEEFFAGAAEQYIRSHPPASGNLHDFGGALPGFLERFKPAQELVYLPDVARLEWARQLSYHAADAPTLEVATLKMLSPESYAELRFEQHPATQLIGSSYPIFAIWQLHQSSNSAAGVDLGLGGEQVRVFRDRLAVAQEPLGLAEYLWLQALGGGKTLGQATDLALAANTSFDLAQTLQRHLAVGTWTTLNPPPQPSRTAGPFKETA